MSPFADGENWYLLNDFKISIDGEEITVPKGFVTDFASIPPPISWWLPKWELYGQAAIVHDFLYWDQHCKQEQADQILLIAMRDDKVDFFSRNTIYTGVRLGGWYTYNIQIPNRYKRDENKVILKFPESAREKWDDFIKTNKSPLKSIEYIKAEPKPKYCNILKKL